MFRRVERRQLSSRGTSDATVDERGCAGWHRLLPLCLLIPSSCSGCTALPRSFFLHSPHHTQLSRASQPTPHPGSLKAQALCSLRGGRDRLRGSSQVHQRSLAIVFQKSVLLKLHCIFGGSMFNSNLANRSVTWKVPMCSVHLHCPLMSIVEFIWVG